MRVRMLMVPVLGLSLICFLLATTAGSDDAAMAWAILGAIVPIIGIGVVHASNLLRWRRMGAALGLVANGGGAYPDMSGPYRGRRLVIMRRRDNTGLGPRLSTIVRLEGVQELRLPGFVADAGVVKGILKPFVD